MKFLCSVLVAVWALSVTTAGLAQNNETIAPELVTELSQNPIWKKILVYGDNNRSSITSPSFFLSPTGQTSAADELSATINAFKKDDRVNFKSQEGSNSSAQCRFPARFIWLSHQLDFTKLGITKIACPEFEQFRNSNSGGSLSMIYATGYLGNPASYYGHLLLKINTGDINKTSNLEDAAVNYGANVPPNENMILYILKGIFGSYASSFTSQKYFYHSHNYGESEQRDLWEYQLNFNQSDQLLLIAHLWEVLGAEYTYYFFNRNCAYRMGELLQLVLDKPLVDPQRPWQIPQAVIQRTANYDYQGEPLVKSIIYHPSRQSRLYQRFNQLSGTDQLALKAIVKQPDELNTRTLSDLSTLSQHKVVDTLIDYYEYVRDPKAGTQDKFNELYRRSLSKRYQLPPGDTGVKFKSENQPQLGRNPSYLSGGIISNHERGQALRLWLRPAYYDSLDASYGHIKNASLSMAELKLDISSEELRVLEFNIVKIESLRRNLTGLPGDRHASWYLDTGVEQHNLACDDCLDFKLRSGYGYASSFWRDKLLISGFIGAGFLGDSFKNDWLYSSASTNLNLELTPKIGFRVELEKRFFYSNQVQEIAQLQARYATSKQSDLRVFYGWNQSSEAGIYLGYYW